MHQGIGTLHGKTIELDHPVPDLDGQRVRLVVEGAADDEVPLSALAWEHAPPRGGPKSVRPF